MYYWGGIPYYYYEDSYYTYNATDAGYVVTDPPPVVDPYSDPEAQLTPPPDEGEAGTDVPPEGGAPPPEESEDLYAYPTSGQSDEQTQNDKYECHKWAIGQTGFDPNAADPRGNPDDFRNAKISCLESRGYSVK